MSEKYIIYAVMAILLIIFLVVAFVMQKKAAKYQVQLYKEYLKDNLAVLQESNKYTKRIAEALEKKNDGK